MRRIREYAFSPRSKVAPAEEISAHVVYLAGHEVIRQRSDDHIDGGFNTSVFPTLANLGSDTGSVGLFGQSNHGTKENVGRLQKFGRCRR